MQDIQEISHSVLSKSVAFISGGGASLTAFFLHIKFSDWAFDTSLKMIEVGMVGVVGGAAGLVGKHVVEKYLFKKNKVIK